MIKLMNTVSKINSWLKEDGLLIVAVIAWFTIIATIALKIN